MSKVGSKIRQFRELKNYTQKYMADQLNISQNSYSRIENETINISISRLKEIAKILEVEEIDLLNTDTPIYNFNSTEKIINAGHFENLYQQNDDVNSKIIQMLQMQIEELKKDKVNLMRIIDDLNRNGGGRG